MRAIVLNPPGGDIENMVFADVAAPTAGPGEVVVNVVCAGLNFADMMMRIGTYPHPKGYPLVAGLEIAGYVAEIGPGVAGLAIGDRVAAFSEEAGGFAEMCAVPAERLVRLPDAMSFLQGAAFVIQALTAWHMLHTISTTSRGDTILVHAIGGGVGLYLTQLAARAGAVVIGTVGTRGKEQRALEYGAARVINREDEDFVDAVMAATDGKGVDKIVDFDRRQHSGSQLLGDPQARSRGELWRGGSATLPQPLGAAGEQIADLFALPSRTCGLPVGGLAKRCGNGDRRHCRRVAQGADRGRVRLRGRACDVREAGIAAGGGEVAAQDLSWALQAGEGPLTRPAADLSPDGRGGGSGRSALTLEELAPAADQIAVFVHEGVPDADARHAFEV